MKIDTARLKNTLVNFIVPLICVALCLILFLLVALPAFNKKPDLEKDLKQKQDLSAQLETKIVNLKKLVDFKIIVDENSLLVSNALVSDAMVPQLLTQVDQIAKESGLVVSRLSYSLTDTTNSANAIKAKLAYSTVTVSLGISGNYDQLALFFANLENAARLVNVDSFRYTLSASDKVTALDISVILISPYLTVESNAVTDGPVNLDMSNGEFVNTLNKVKSLKLYKPTAEETSKFAQEQPTKESTPSQGSTPTN